jgi:tetratricopeptide (TPR) repeat protein
MDALKHLAQLVRQQRQISGDADILDDPVYISVQANLAALSTLLGFHEEGEAISRECLEQGPLPGLESERSLCLQNLGVIAERSGAYTESKTYLEKAIALGKKHPNPLFPTYYLWLGYVHFLLGDFTKGMACFQESYDLFDENDTLWGKAFALSKMGLAADGLKEYTHAMAYYREALSIFESIDDDFGIAYTYSRLSVGAYFIGSYQQALDYGKISHQMFKVLNHRWGLGATLCRMGFAHLGLGQSCKAAAAFDQALEISWSSQQKPLSLYALIGQACAMLFEGDQNLAVALFDYTRQHTQTPALYIDMAKPWFEKVGIKNGAFPDVLIGEDGEVASLEEVIAQFLPQDFPTMVQKRS